MTKKQALENFRKVCPPVTFTNEHNGRIDRFMRAETWNNFTDDLCKSGQISMKQYETWINPFK